MEALLLRLVPGLAQAWEGATDHEIEQIERIAGRPLPRFYRWFLMRMGHSMGPIAYPTLDFSAPKVLACYAERLFAPNPRFLMIGYESNEMMPLHVLYDFDHPARDDARVTKRHSMGGATHDQFETFREMMAWREVTMRGIETRSQRCVGMFTDPGGDVLSHLDPVMKSLGFTSPIESGPRCGLYESEHAAMVTSCAPDNDPRFHVFRIGASDQGRIRRFLGEITAETSLEMEIDEWAPPV